MSLLDVFGDEIAHYSLKKKDSVNNKGFFMSSIIVPHEVLLLNIYRCFMYFSLSSLHAIIYILKQLAWDKNIISLFSNVKLSWRHITKSPMNILFLYVLLEMEFSSHRTSQPLPLVRYWSVKSILVKQFNDSVWDVVV